MGTSRLVQRGGVAPQSLRQSTTPTSRPATVDRAATRDGHEQAEQRLGSTVDAGKGGEDLQEGLADHFVDVDVRPLTSDVPGDPWGPRPPQDLEAVLVAGPGTRERAWDVRFLHVSIIGHRAAPPEGGRGGTDPSTGGGVRSTGRSL
mgnify:CR=1 FL=1